MTAPLVVGDIFRNAARAVPGRTAAVLGEHSLTFGDIDSLGNRIAQSLRAKGMRDGDRVATWTTTSLDVVPVFAALAKLGAVFAPLNALWGEAEASDVIGRLRPSFLVVDADHAEVARAVANRFGVRVEFIDAAATEAASFPDEDPGGLVEEENPHVIFFTSGSSGVPKGAVLSHRVNVLRSLPGALLEPRGPMVCPYPLFHMGAWTIALQQWQARDAVVFVHSATASEIGTAVERHRATRLNAIPAVWRRLLDAQDGADPPDLSSIRFADTGTSATPPELLRSIGRALPDAHVRVFYGSTEAGGVTLLEQGDMERKPGSCGVPGPLVTLRTDAAGQLLVRGPLLFDGYYGDAAASADALHDGWYATGDLAELDAEGYVTIVGRVGEVIRTGGEAVTPAEVEIVLVRHPQVEDAAVIGLPDDEWGEVVCAVMVPVSGASAPDLASLRAFCTDSLASYKHPRKLVVVDEIPRTPATGQVQRRRLIEQLG